jgi:hypothetical protein
LPELRKITVLHSKLKVIRKSRQQGILPLLQLTSYFVSYTAPNHITVLGSTDDFIASNNPWKEQKLISENLVTSQINLYRTHCSYVKYNKNTATARTVNKTHI